MTAPSSRPPAYRWLHLSDLHLAADGPPVFWSVLEPFERSLQSWLPQLGGPLDLLLLTGDLAAHGEPGDYERLDELLARVLDLLEKHAGARPLVVPVPGNHDVLRPDARALRQYRIVDALYPQKLGDTAPIDEDVKFLRTQLWKNHDPDIFADLFPAYTAWLDRTVLPPLRAAAHATLHTSFFPGDLTVTIDRPDRFPLALVGLNTAWSHYKSGDFAGRLHLPQEQLLAALPEPPKGASPLDLFKRYTRALLLQHHPRKWLTEPARRAFEAEIYPPQRFTACLFGHMHEPDAVNEARAGGRSRTYYQAPSFFGLEHYGEASESRIFGYTFGQLSQDGELRVWPLRATRKGDGAWAFDRDTYFHWSDNDLDGVLLRPADPPPEPARTRGAAQVPAPGVADLDLADYCSDVRDRTATLKLDGIAAAKKTLTYPIEALYTRLRTHARERERPVDPGRVAHGDLVDLADLLPNHRRLLLEGQPGCGKTTFLKLAASVLARDQLDEPCPGAASWRAAHLGRDVPRTLPVFLRLSALVPDTGARARWRGDARLLDLLAADSVPPASPPEAAQLARATWDRHLRSGGVTLLLDGLDEVSDPALRDPLFAALNAILRTWPKCQVVVTSRPIDLDRLTDDLGFVRASVAPFGDDEIHTYVGRWVHALFEKDPDMLGGRAEDDYARGLVAALQARPELRRLSASPVLLTALCVVYSYGQKLPEGRAELYRETIRLLLEARDEVRSEHGYPSLRVQEALSALALGMMGGTAPGAPKVRELGFVDAAAFVAPLVRGPAFDTNPAARKAAICRWLRFECEYSGVIEEVGDGQLRFKHLTFQEYLAAAHLALLERDEWWRIIEPHLEDLQWRETIDLLPGCLLDRTRGATKDADHLVEKIHALFPDRPRLLRAATITALTGRLLPAFRASGYSPPVALAAVDDALRREAEAIFTVEGAAKIDEQTRIAAAEAIGRAGDRRLAPERFEDNLLEVPGTTICLGKYPVTIEEFARFIDDGGYQYSEFWPVAWALRDRAGWVVPGFWEEQSGNPNRPVIGVSWFEGLAYCRWLSKNHHRRIRMPTEVEWMSAASPDRRPYPWGDERPDDRHANFGKESGAPTPVGVYPAGNGKYGHCDLAGNVWEWVGDPSEGNHRVCGGSYMQGSVGVRARGADVGPESRRRLRGFRVASDSS